MKLFKLAFEQLAERKGIVSLMIIELTITLIAFNIFTSQLADLYDQSKVYDMANTDVIWISDEENMQNITDEGSALLSYGVKPIKNCGQVEILPQGEIHKMNNDNPTIYLWPEEYYQELNLNLDKGDLMSEPKNGCLNIIVPRGLSGKYRVGNTYEVSVWYNTYLDTGESLTIDLYVCGVLENTMVLEPDGTVSNRNSGIFGLDLSDKLKNIPNDNPAYYFFFDYALNTEESANMSRFAWSLEEKAKNSQSILLSELRLPIVISVAVLCFCLSAFLGYNILSLIDQEKRMAIYFMCGATVRDIIGIKLLHNAILIGVPLIISLIGILGVYLFGFIAEISWLGIAVSYLLILLIFSLSSMLFIRKLSKKSIVSFIHKWL